jgi:hypothetical protein
MAIAVEGAVGAGRAVPPRDSTLLGGQSIPPRPPPPPPPAKVLVLVQVVVELRPAAQHPIRCPRAGAPVSIDHRPAVLQIFDVHSGSIQPQAH